MRRIMALSCLPGPLSMYAVWLWKAFVASSIDWLPNRRGIVAVACTEPLSFDERIAQAGRVKTSAILIWNFKDPIHPQCVLESPSDIMCFRFNEQSPHLVAGGMYNGQVVLWDTSEAGSRKLTGKPKKDASGGAGAADEAPEGGEEASIPVIKCKYLSSVDASHTYPVSDLCWMRMNMTVDAAGRLVRATGEEPAQAEGQADRADAHGPRATTQQSTKHMA